MKSNILINCLVLFYNVGIFLSDLLTFFILIDSHSYFEVFATEPYLTYFFTARKITTIIWNLVINKKIYEDEIGYQKSEIRKRKIVETEKFSVDTRIKIISE